MTTMTKALISVIAAVFFLPTHGAWALQEGRIAGEVIHISGNAFTSLSIVTDYGTSSLCPTASACSMTTVSSAFVDLGTGKGTLIGTISPVIADPTVPGAPDWTAAASIPTAGAFPASGALATKDYPFTGTIDFNTGRFCTAIRTGRGNLLFQAGHFEIPVDNGVATGYGFNASVWIDPSSGTPTPTAVLDLVGDYVNGSPSTRVVTTYEATTPAPGCPKRPS